MRGLLVACTLAIARFAFADGAGVIAASTGDRSAVAAAMAEAMTGRGRVAGDAIGQARTALAAGAVPTDTLARFKRVRDQVDEGWRAYLRVAIELAAQRLGSARTEAEALVALPGGAEVYADAALRLGAVLGQLGRKQEAQAVLALALALDPDRPITTAEFSPDVLDAVDAVRALTPAMGKLEIRSEPAGAAVRVDGKDAGKTPVAVDVTVGQHVVVARLSGHHPTAQGVAVSIDTARAPSSAGGNKIDLALEPDVDAAALAIGGGLGLDEPGQQRLVNATMRYADLDELVVVAETVRHGGPVLLAQRCGGLPAKCSAVVEIAMAPGTSLPTAAKSAWDAVRGAELRYPPTALGERGGPVVAHGCRWCRNPWLWGGVGAAVVTGAVVTLIVTSGSKPNPIVMTDPDMFHR